MTCFGTPDRIEGVEFTASGHTIETSTGTFGDPSRFLQTLAGVVSDTDQRNDFLVRGGNPDENLFVIDNIEIPTINQLALSDTTGGFVSMLDSHAIQQLTLHTDTYDDKFEQRLSSVVEISTRPSRAVARSSTMELGLTGLGGSITRPFDEDGSIFFDAHQSVLQYVTHDIGLNGVPEYRNFFLRGEARLSPFDTLWGISLSGVDSLAIRPSATDTAETNPYNINYSGWRSTTGINWQHVFSARAFGVLSLAHSDQSQTLHEDAQLEDGTDVYSEASRDSMTTLKFDSSTELRPWITITAGVRAALDQLHYAVSQPVGLQNPYSPNAAAEDQGAFDRSFATFAGESYVQAAIHLPYGATLVVGDRAMQWALIGSEANTAKALISVPLFGRLFHVGVAQYAQLPPTLYLLSFKNAQQLGPIHSRQVTTGLDLFNGTFLKVKVEAYQKRYSDYPVASEYPQLSLATIADTFGQAFLLFPMQGSGVGLAEGAEVTVQVKPGARFSLAATGAYARSWYAGLNGVLRRSNYDLPVTANIVGAARIGRMSLLSFRESYASGKPYTPDLLPLSYAQDRDVYDLTRINAVRSSFYARLDLRFEQTRRVRSGMIMWYAGLDNVLNRKNFYSQVWLPRTDAGTSEQYQMPRVPDGGMKLLF